MRGTTDDPTGPVFDATPYLRLVIDKDGRWFQNGAEIIHPGIYAEFNRMLEKTGDGGYQVRLGREMCRVEVEDAPFVVRRLWEADDDEIDIELNDGTRERFNPEHFWIGDENIPYVRVKDRVFHARFSRPAYYQLADRIAPESTEKGFVLTLGGKTWPIQGTPHLSR
jgi:uncharacterized protein